MTYLRITLKTIGLYVNPNWTQLSLGIQKVIVRCCLKVSLKIVVNVIGIRQLL